MQTRGMAPKQRGYGTFLTEQVQHLRGQGTADPFVSRKQLLLQTGGEALQPKVALQVLRMNADT